MSARPEKTSGLPPSQNLPNPDLRRSVLPLIVCQVLVLSVYVWLISVGTWTHWPTRWHLYDTLATSFRRGQLALEEKPSPLLLSLADPYDPAARTGMPFPPDMSLYNGQYYVYFGPVPALLLAAAKSVIPGQIGDQFLVFAFIAGISIVQSLLIVMIRRRFFPDVSAWALAGMLLVAGLMNPLAWVLSTPTVYSAAIAGGQFFLLAGFFAAFSAFRHGGILAPKMALAGLLWAGALGSRITQCLPIGLLVVLIVIRAALQYQATGGLRRQAGPLLSLIGVLGLGAAALCWYNWARFGSIFETGITYQLAGVPLQQYSRSIYSLRYVPQNLYNYLFNPPKIRYAVPYFSPLRGRMDSLIPSLSLAPLYHAQEITGLLYGAPFLVLALPPLLSLLRGSVRQWASDAEQGGLRWLTVGLFGAFIPGFVLFLAFFWAAERYMLDFLPPLFLLSVIGSWQVGERLARRPWSRRFYWAALICLMTASAVVGTLLAISFNADGFRQLNPVLWRQLGNLFRP